jgi:hypothetical protein
MAYLVHHPFSGFFFDGWLTGEFVAYHFGILSPIMVGTFFYLSLAPSQ